MEYLHFLYMVTSSEPYKPVQPPPSSTGPSWCSGICALVCSCWLDWMTFWLIQEGPPWEETLCDSNWTGTEQFNWSWVCFRWRLCANLSSRCTRVSKYQLFALMRPDKQPPKSWGGKARLAVEDLSNIKRNLSVILKDGRIRSLFGSKLFQQ